MFTLGTGPGDTIVIPFTQGVVFIPKILDGCENSLAQCSDLKFDGSDVYFQFESYAPTSGQYGGDRATKILLKFRTTASPADYPRVLDMLLSKLTKNPATKTLEWGKRVPLPMEGYSYVNYSDAESRLTFGSKSDVIDNGVHFGVVGGSYTSTPSVFIACAKNGSFLTMVQTLVNENPDSMTEIAKQLDKTGIMGYNPVTMMTNTPELPYGHWALYVPTNDIGSHDPKGNNMRELNREDALKSFLLNRCMGVTREGCRTGKPTCTQFMSSSSASKICNDVAKMSDYAKQAAYKAVCGIQPDGEHMGQPFVNLTPVRDALATVDCSCINYKNSTYAQPNLVGRDYARFVNDFPKLDLPDEAYCWWPTCTEKSQTLTVTSQSGPTDSSLYDPKCPAIINNMKRITAGQDPLLPGDKGFTPSSSGAGFSTPASDTQGPESGSDTTNVHTPAGVMDQVKLLPKLSWFIPVVVVLGILILAAIGWFVYQNYFSKTTTAATPLKPKTPALRPIGKA
jgi:hypothetical protein